jgi:cytosine/uracil/thiamine/allantoin permease
MNSKPDPDNAQASDRLHPLVYKILAALAICLVVSAWIFFSQGGYLDLTLAIVGVFLVMIIGIPIAIHYAGQGFQPPDRTRPFKAWISGYFDMRQGRRTSASAAVEILLPMAAAAVGITAIGIVFRITEAGGSWL